MRKIAKTKTRLTEATDWRKMIDSYTKLLQTLNNKEEAEQIAQELKEIFEDYFTQTWGAANVAAVVRLGEAVRQELLTLGFSKELNPFISAIDTILENKLNLTAQQYGTLHNAYIFGKLDKEDLSHIGKVAPFYKNDLLLMRDFYANDAKTKQQLLTLRKQAKDWYKSMSGTDVDADSKAKSIEEIKNIFFTNNKINPIEDIIIKLKELTGKDIDIGQEEKKSKFAINDPALVAAIRDDARGQTYLAYAVNSIIIKSGISGKKLDSVKSLLDPNRYNIIGDFYKQGDAITLSQFYNKYLNKYDINKDNAEAIIKSLLDTFASKSNSDNKAAGKT